MIILKKSKYMIYMIIHYMMEKSSFRGVTEEMYRFYKNMVPLAFEL